MPDPKEEKETDALPEENKAAEVATDDVVEVEPTAEARIRELELDKARLEGRNEVLSRTPEAAPASQASAWKATVWQDIERMPEEDFEQKYRMKKHLASSEMLKRDFEESTMEQKQQMAELQAENRLAARYPDYFSRQESVREALVDASPEVRRDPAKLAKFLERALLADKAAHPTATPKAPKSERRIVDPAFDRPEPRSEVAPKNGKNEIAAEYRSLARVFGIKDESERKELMDSPFIPMNLGDGIVFRDPEVGFEKKAI